MITKIKFALLLFTHMSSVVLAEEGGSGHYMPVPFMWAEVTAKVNSVTVSSSFNGLGDIVWFKLVAKF